VVASLGFPQQSLSANWPSHAYNGELANPSRLTAKQTASHFSDFRGQEHQVFGELAHTGPVSLLRAGLQRQQGQVVSEPI
jgi:hypothetical protein